MAPLLLALNARGSDDSAERKTADWNLNDNMNAIASILVVDDNNETLNTFAKLLSALGVKDVCCASSAEHALEILKTRTFGMILCDYRLEGMDGVEFLEQIRAQGDKTPLIMVSGAPDKAGVIRATRQENVNFFGKPFRVEELARAMEKMADAA